MIRWWNASHPGDVTLSRWLDAGAPAAGDATAHHVATCDRCARRTDAWQAIRRTARDLAAVPDEAPPALLDRVLATRVTLPPARVRALPTMTRSRPMGRRLGQAAVFALALGLLTFRPWAPTRLEAGQERGRVVAADGGLRPGTTVTLRYEPIPALAMSDSVLIRLRVLTDAIADRGTVREDAVVLRRDGAVFTGRWAFARDGAAVFAAVDGFDGATVDANGDRLFALLAVDSAGQPTVGALFQALTMHDATLLPRSPDNVPPFADGLRGRDSLWRALLRQHHPMTPESWAVEGAIRQPLAGLAFVRAFAGRTLALARLDRRLRAARGLPWRTRYAMERFARQQEEPEVAAEWAARLPPAPRPAARQWDTVTDVVTRRDTAAARAMVRDPRNADRRWLGGLFLTFGPGRHGWRPGAGLLSCREILDAAQEAAERPNVAPPLVLGQSRQEAVALVQERRAEDMAIARSCERGGRLKAHSHELENRADRLHYAQPPLRLP